MELALPSAASSTCMLTERGSRLTVSAHVAKHFHQHWPFYTCLGLQVRSEQLAEEHTELVALRHELNQRDRELSRRATEQATEAANTQVSIFVLCWPRAACSGAHKCPVCRVAAAAVSRCIT